MQVGGVLSLKMKLQVHDEVHMCGTDRDCSSLKQTLEQCTILLAPRLHVHTIDCPTPQSPTNRFISPSAPYAALLPCPGLQKAHALAGSRTCLNVLCAASHAAQACVLVQQGVHLQGGQLADLVPVRPAQQVRGLFGGMGMLVAVGLHLVQDVAQEGALHRGKPAQAEQLQQASTASDMLRAPCSSRTLCTKGVNCTE